MCLLWWIQRFGSYPDRAEPYFDITGPEFVSTCEFLSVEEMSSYPRSEWQGILNQPILVRMLCSSNPACSRVLLDETEALLPEVQHLLRRDRMSAACNEEINARLRWQTSLRRAWIVACVELSL